MKSILENILELNEEKLAEISSEEAMDKQWKTVKQKLEQWGYGNVLMTVSEANEIMKMKKQEAICQNCGGLANCATRGWITKAWNEDGYLRLAQARCKKLEKATADAYFFSKCEEADLPLNLLIKNPYDWQLETLKTIKGEITNIKSNRTEETWRKIDFKLAKTRKWFYISGAKGRGKTTLGLMAGMYGVQLGLSVKYINFVEYMSGLKPESASDYIAEILKYDILIIDEYGTQFRNEWNTEREFLLIDGRYRRNVVTIFISNYQLKDQDAGRAVGLWDRIRDRISERIS